MLQDRETAPTRSAPLFQSERQRKIVTLVDTHGAIEVAELARHFQVTTETVRRDLSDLQDKRLLKRVHGGAVRWEPFEPLVIKRTAVNNSDKRRIATKAIEELPEAGSILIDAGSTLLRFAESIPAGRHLHVVTNSLPTAQAIASVDSATVSLLGGEVRSDTLSIVDAHAVEEIRKLHVDVLFISTDGATETGLSTPYTYEASLKGAMIAAAERVVALIDPSKFGQDHLFRYSDWSDIDVLVTGMEADAQTLESIRAADVDIRLV